MPEGYVLQERGRQFSLKTVTGAGNFVGSPVFVARHICSTGHISQDGRRGVHSRPQLHSADSNLQADFQQGLVCPHLDVAILWALLR